MLSQLLTLLAVLPSCALAYTIHSDCIDPGFLAIGTNIPAAVAETLSIAEYAIWRLQTNDPAVGPVLQQLLGNDGNAKSSFTSMSDAPAAAAKSGECFCVLRNQRC